jgi:GntR family transcriptional regulator
LLVKRLGALVIEFHLNSRSGVAPYLQLVRQVRQALRLGLLQAGDQLPTVKDVAGSLAIKAYRVLEYEGLAAAKPGVGTFVTKTVSDESVSTHKRLNLELAAWVGRAQLAGLDFEDMEALFQRAVRSAAQEEAV